METAASSSGERATVKAPSAPSANIRAPEPAPRTPGTEGRGPTTLTTRITISTAETQYQLAHPLELRVEYSNIGEVEVTFPEPTKTWELMLRVKRGGIERSAPFGRLFHTVQGGIERTVTEDTESVTLHPGHSYSFTEDVGTRWPFLFDPGRSVVQVVDRAAGIESNSLSLQIVIAKESLPLLLDLAESTPPPRSPARSSSDDSFAVANREFAVRWIREFYPSLALQLPTADPAVEAKNQAAVRNARAYWAKHGGSAEVLAKLVELNRLGFDGS